MRLERAVTRGTVVATRHRIGPYFVFLTRPQGSARIGAEPDYSAGVQLLLVEDDRKLGTLLVRVLEDHDYEVTLCRSVAAVREGVFDRQELAIVDWMLPDGDGLEVCTMLRRASFLGPIMMLTARGETKDKVQALDLGADDYVTKPFALDELLARIRALARRGAHLLTFDAGPIHVDVAKRYAFVRGRLLDLTARELEVLTYLVRRPDTIVSKGELAEAVWEAGETMWNAVEVNVSRLRDKLGEDAALLETVRGRGYRLWART